MSSQDWELEREDPRYPEGLLDLSRPPERLYGRGDLEILSEPSLSVVGARRATPYGQAVSEMVGRIAADCGIVVVSGGAMGCDHAVARAALDVLTEDCLILIDAGGRHAFEDHAAIDRQAVDVRRAADRRRTIRQ